jgi:hypothetical protein
MANRFGSQLALLHVVDLPPAWYGSPEGAYSIIREAPCPVISI